MARQLLRKLLSYPSLLTCLHRSSGETALASIIHNPSCLERLTSLSPPPTSSSTTTRAASPSLSPARTNAAPASTGEGGEEGEGEEESRKLPKESKNVSSYVVMPSLRPAEIRPYVALEDHAYSTYGSEGGGDRLRTGVVLHHRKHTDASYEEVALEDTETQPSLRHVLNQLTEEVLNFAPPQQDAIAGTCDDHRDQAGTPAVVGVGVLDLGVDHAPLRDGLPTPPPLLLLDPSSQEMDCAPSPTQNPKSGDFHFLGGDVGVAEGGGDSQCETKAAASPVTNKVQGGSSDGKKQEVVGGVVGEVPDKIGTRPIPSDPDPTSGKESSEQQDTTIFGRSRASPVIMPSSSLLGEDTAGSTPSTSARSASAPSLQGPLLFGKGSSLSSVDLEGLRIGSKSNVTLKESVCSSTGEFNAVHALFSNWPAIVTTILGFDPAPYDHTPSSGDDTGTMSCGHTPSRSRDHAPSSSSHDSTSAPSHPHDHAPSSSPSRGHTPSTPSRGHAHPSRGHTPQFSSVHMLDSFTTDLFLNSPTHAIDSLVNTILLRLNSALEQLTMDEGADEVGVGLFLREIDYSDLEVVERFLRAGQVGVAMLVGRRFLGSVVRVLSLEHSRVKNRFMEMQQQQARQGQSRRAAEGGAK